LDNKINNHAETSLYSKRIRWSQIVIFPPLGEGQSEHRLCIAVCEKELFKYYQNLLILHSLIIILQFSRCAVYSLSPSVVKQHVGYDAEQHTWQDDLWSKRSKKGIETNSFYMINFRSRGAFARRYTGRVSKLICKNVPNIAQAFYIVGS
jgi:hypothetical protein